jgi:hypothetical protein
MVVNVVGVFAVNEVPYECIFSFNSELIINLY